MKTVDTPGIDETRLGDCSVYRRTEPGYPAAHLCFFHRLSLYLRHYRHVLDPVRWCPKSILRRWCGGRILWWHAQLWLPCLLRSVLSCKLDKPVKFGTSIAHPVSRPVWSCVLDQTFFLQRALITPSLGLCGLAFLTNLLIYATGSSTHYRFVHQSICGQCNVFAAEGPYFGKHRVHGCHIWLILQ